jgi:hypothetical protein
MARIFTHNQNANHEWTLIHKEQTTARIARLARKGKNSEMCEVLSV